MSFRILLDGHEREVAILARTPNLVISVDGRRMTVTDPGREGDGLDRFIIDGRELSLARVQTASGLVLRTGGRTFTADLLVAGDDGAGAGASGDIRAPMPGAVVSIDVAAGQTLRSGDPVLTIESMKLQTVLSAPRAGTVAEILVADGEGFDKDQVLVRLAGEEDENA